MIVFRYKFELIGRGKETIKRPVADIFLKTNSNDWIEFHPYIDSGADMTMIPLSLGKLIGLEINKGKIQQIGGISGSVPVIAANLTVKIGTEIFSPPIAWALVEDIPPLLGRAGVFDVFKVTFKQYENIIFFEKK